VWLHRVWADAGFGVGISSCVQAVQVAQRGDNVIQPLGTASLLGLARASRHTFSTVAQLGSFTRSQWNKSAGTAASVLPEGSLEPVPTTCFRVEFRLGPFQGSLSLGNKFAKRAHLGTPR